MTPTQYGAAFARFWWLILVTTVLGALLMVARDGGVATEYESTARVSVGATPLAADNSTDKYYASVRATQADTLAKARMPLYETLGDDSSLAARVQQENPSAASSDVAERIEVEAIETSAALLIRVTDPDAAAAQRLAGQAADALAGMITDLERERRGETLLRARVVGEATPATAAPAAPAWRNPLIGAAAGLALGVALALLLTRLDRRVRNEQSVEELLGAPVLGNLPTASGGRRAALGMGSGGSIDDLRTNVYFLRHDAGRGLRLALTSTPRAKGVAGLASALADSLADTGARVLLVDADLRPDADRVPGSSSGEGGLAQLLVGADAGGHVVSGQRGNGVDLLPAGETSSDGDDLLHGPAFAELLDRAASEYDYVVIRSAPVGEGTGARAAAARSDATLVALGRRGTSRAALTGARDDLRKVDAHVAGAVLVS